MSEDVGSGSRESAPAVRSTSLARRFVVYGGVLLVVFLLGLVPMWLQARAAAGKLAEAERRLTLAGMQGDLASAAVDARRGDYEPSRQAVSRFFTALRAEVDKGEGSHLTQAQRAGVEPLFAGRDEVITLLARSDPASADRLSDLYVAYRRTVGG